MSLFGEMMRLSLPLVPKPIVSRVARRYVAGDTLDEAAAVALRFADRRMGSTLALLGEEVTEQSEATAAVEHTLELVDVVQQRKLRSGISVKLTLLGLEIDAGFCRENLWRVLEYAARERTFVRIDMEDHTTTDETLRIFREARERYAHVGIVLQAYLRRTIRDIAELPAASNVRICKGIYVEPREVAFQDFETVRRNFVACVDHLVADGHGVGIATHDELLIAESLASVQGLDESRYEFQFLLGVDEQQFGLLRAEGHRVRVYVPYGRDWYPYCIRRLRENPKIAVYVLRAMLRRT